MANTIYENYLETEVLSANPLELVDIMYRAAIESVASARRHLEDGAIRERSRQINRASEIINELMFSLDHEQGGRFSRNLAELYSYMQTRLIEANARQADLPMAEVQELLLTLLEGWQTIGASAPAPAECLEPAGFVR